MEHLPSNHDEQRSELPIISTLIALTRRIAASCKAALEPRPRPRRKRSPLGGIEHLEQRIVMSATPFGVEAAEVHLLEECNAHHAHTAIADVIVASDRLSALEAGDASERTAAIDALRSDVRQLEEKLSELMNPPVDDVESVVAAVDALSLGGRAVHDIELPHADRRVTVDASVGYESGAYDLARIELLNAGGEKFAYFFTSNSYVHTGVVDSVAGQSSVMQKTYEGHVRMELNGDFLTIQTEDDTHELRLADAQDVHAVRLYSKYGITFGNVRIATVAEERASVDEAAVAQAEQELQAARDQLSALEARTESEWLAIEIAEERSRLEREAEAERFRHETLPTLSAAEIQRDGLYDEAMAALAEQRQLLVEANAHRKCLINQAALSAWHFDPHGEVQSASTEHLERLRGGETSERTAALTDLRARIEQAEQRRVDMIRDHAAVTESIVDGASVDPGRHGTHDINLEEPGRHLVITGDVSYQGSAYDLIRIEFLDANGEKFAYFFTSGTYHHTGVVDYVAKKSSVAPTPYGGGVRIELNDDTLSVEAGSIREQVTIRDPQDVHAVRIYGKYTVSVADLSVTQVLQEARPVDTEAVADIDEGLTRLQERLDAMEAQTESEWLAERIAYEEAMIAHQHTLSACTENIERTERRISWMQSQLEQFTMRPDLSVASIDGRTVTLTLRNTADVSKIKGGTFGRYLHHEGGTDFETLSVILDPVPAGEHVRLTLHDGSDTMLDSVTVVAEADGTLSAEGQDRWRGYEPVRAMHAPEGASALALDIERDLETVNMNRRYEERVADVLDAHQVERAYIGVNTYSGGASTLPNVRALDVFVVEQSGIVATMETEEEYLARVWPENPDMSQHVWNEWHHEHRSRYREAWGGRNIYQDSWWHRAGQPILDAVNAVIDLRDGEIDGQEATVRMRTAYDAIPDPPHRSTKTSFGTFMHNVLAIADNGTLADHMREAGADLEHIEAKAANIGTIASSHTDITASDVERGARYALRNGGAVRIGDHVYEYDGATSTTVVRDGSSGAIIASTGSGAFAHVAAEVRSYTIASAADETDRVTNEEQALALARQYLEREFKSTDMIFDAAVAGGVEIIEYGDGRTDVVIAESSLQRLAQAILQSREGVRNESLTTEEAAQAVAAAFRQEFTTIERTMIMRRELVASAAVTYSGEDVVNNVHQITQDMVESGREGSLTMEMQRNGRATAFFTLNDTRMVNLWHEGTSYDMNLTLTGGDLPSEGLSSAKPGATGESFSVRLGPGTYVLTVDDATVYTPEFLLPAPRPKVSFSMAEFNSANIEGKISVQGTDHVEKEVMDVSLRVAEFEERGRRIEDYQTERIPQLDPSKPVWVVIHGKNSSETDKIMEQLANSLHDHQHQKGFQVVTLDWEEAARDGFFIQDAQWAPAVGQWAVQQLVDTGFTGDQINMAGWSHGSYVAFEAGRELQRMGYGGMNALVALDAARNIPALSGYDHLPINFADVSNRSLAIDSSIVAGSDSLAGTADLAFKVRALHSDLNLTFAKHKFAVTAFSSMLEREHGAPGPFTDHFSLSGIMGSMDTISPYLHNAYDGVFEGYIDVTVDGAQANPIHLRYIDQADEPERIISYIEAHDQA